MTTSPTSRSRRGLAAGLALGLVGGTAAGLVVAVPGITGASANTVEQTADPDSTVPDTPSDPGSPSPDREHRRGGGVERTRERLQELVDAGTITAEQADAVAEHLGASSGRGGEWGGRGHRGGPGRFVFGSGTAAVLDELLGLDMRELLTQLRDGATIAEIAEANGIELQPVIDELVASAQQWLDRAVEAGHMTEDEAAAKLAEITAQIDDVVHNGGNWFNHRGPGRPDASPDTTVAD